MNNQDRLILLKDQRGDWIPKSFEVESIFFDNNRGVYEVTFTTNGKTFFYSRDKVRFLEKNDVEYNPLKFRITRNGRVLTDIERLNSYMDGSNLYWSFFFKNGTRKDYNNRELEFTDVTESVLDYLKCASQVNNLGKPDVPEGILYSIYKNIKQIDSDSVAAPYDNPKRYKLHTHECGDLIFPFGCNSSQEKAVRAAFENQVSIIQGPPGTGKTQTILNIIANIVSMKKTVLVVSNNNSAVLNVQEKLGDYGFGFIAATLGSTENRESFIASQPDVPDDTVLSSWDLNVSVDELTKNLSRLREAFYAEERLVALRHEQSSLKLEWEHFRKRNGIDGWGNVQGKYLDSGSYLRLWIRFQAYVEDDEGFSLLWKVKKRCKLLYWRIFSFFGNRFLDLNYAFDTEHAEETVLGLQVLFYRSRLSELASEIDATERILTRLDKDSLLKDVTDKSIELFKSSLFDIYHGLECIDFCKIDDIEKYSGSFCRRFPVVFSTTFSACKSVPGFMFDYVVMDESSQVSIDTGFLSLTCARNAVIVGDNKQLTNVVTENDRTELKSIFSKFNLDKAYDCAEYNFLQSVQAVLPGAKNTVLREHYRCHPKIINFCNGRFYGGNLLVMTEDAGEKDVMRCIKTVKGRHRRQGNYNQREIDVIQEEVLPTLSPGEDFGIISPYNEQVNHINSQVQDSASATVHKYQGRGKDVIIMSAVDDQITEFVDTPNLVNVAVSRAKKKFILVVSGNKQERKGIISDLIDYIEYNNFEVSQSQTSSVFDYLYSEYAKEREKYLSEYGKVSNFDSENLMFNLLCRITSSHSEYAHLGVLCHVPLRNVIKDWSLLKDDEKRYISNFSTHLDFLIVNKVSKKPVLSVEVDGYTYHMEGTEQFQRDRMKDHILGLYGLPSVRLKTNGSGEEKAIISKLNELIDY